MSAQKSEARAFIQAGRSVLGIELGSTRIKAVLTGSDHLPIAVGGYSWENKLVDGLWTYDLPEVWTGLQAAYADLCGQVKRQYDVDIHQVAAIGISAMMHGYLAFDEAGQLLTPFRTWRNTTTLQASELLSDVMSFTIPQRWSISHLYQAIMDGEAHVPSLGFLTTLSGYVHWQLTGRKVLGVGDASGMFPIDASGRGYVAQMLDKFDALIRDRGYHWQIRELLPQVLVAGDAAGELSREGARMLDPSGRLQAGIPLCPPEGDAGTGMVATGSVAPRTGNISAGTSIFLMAVLEKALSRHYPEIDMVTTPSGWPVAMVHCNNCTTDLNKWVAVFEGFAKAAGLPIDIGQIYEAFFEQALHGAADAGGLLSYGYYSGEPITGFEEGRPLLAWTPEAELSFANLARAILFSSLGTLRIGMDILDHEQVSLDQLVGHGGLYKTGSAGQRFSAAALKAPVTVMAHAGEGGAWGIALLAAYCLREDAGERLEQFLANRVFAAVPASHIQPEPQDVAGFERFMARYRDGLAIQQAAVDQLR